jgi:hypothetical protein
MSIKTLKSVLMFFLCLGIGVALSLFVIIPLLHALDSDAADTPKPQPQQSQPCAFDPTACRGVVTGLPSTQG